MTERWLKLAFCYQVGDYSPMTDLIGRQFGNYRIDSTIAGGGMGAVYQATDLTLDRPVALKVMHGDLAEDPEFQERFRQEARAAARLDHPSIVRVYQFGSGDGLIYMVMELVDGLSLGAYLRHLAEQDQVVELDETLVLMAQVADALGYAHRQGVIHRDIKPDNILVKRLGHPDRPGEPPLRAMVTDFGLAKLLEAEQDTELGLLMGTLPYMSPEQVMNLPIDGRSDIYSLGVVLYQLATGRAPLNIKTPEEAVRAHQFLTIPMPSEVRPAVPANVERVIMKALARRPENRYQTGEELAAELRQATLSLADEEVMALASDGDSTIVTMITEFPTPVYKITWDMQPRIIINAGVCRVMIDNAGPTIRPLRVSIEDPQQALVADAPSKPVTLAPEQQGMVDFYLQAARRPLFGRTREMPFVMRVTSDPAPAGLPPGVEGVVEAQPRIPVWLLLLSLALFLLLCGVLAWATTLVPSLDSLLSQLGL